MVSIRRKKKKKEFLNRGQRQWEAGKVKETKNKVYKPKKETSLQN